MMSPGGRMPSRRSSTTNGRRGHMEGRSDPRQRVHVGADRIDHARCLSSTGKAIVGAMSSGPTASIVIVSWNGRRPRAVPERRRGAAGHRVRDDSRGQRVHRRNRRVRARAFFPRCGSSRLLKPRLPAATMPVHVTPAAGSSCSSTTTPCPSRGGWRRCATGSAVARTRLPRRRSSTCTIRA